MYFLHMRNDGNGMGAPPPPYDEEDYHMENKRLAQFCKRVDWREKRKRTKGIQEQTYVTMHAHVHFSHSAPFLEFHKFQKSFI